MSTVKDYKPTVLSKLLLTVQRTWSAITQPGTGGLVQYGDWRCIYPDDTRTRWMSHGDAANCRELWGGKLEWRGDVPNPLKAKTK